MTSRPQSTAPTPISSSRLIGDLLVASSAFLDLDAGSALCASVARGETNTNRLFMTRNRSPARGLVRSHESSGLGLAGHHRPRESIVNEATCPARSLPEAPGLITAIREAVTVDWPSHQHVMFANPPRSDGFS